MMSKEVFDPGEHYLEVATRELRRLKTLAEKALQKLSRDDLLYEVLDRESNSIAVLIRHLSGNMLSRWTDFLTSDGEKPDRNRDREFDSGEKTSPLRLMESWNEGWNRLFETLRELGPHELEKRITIRGEDHTVVEAIQRQITHTAYHVGQIVYLTKHFESNNWKSLSIPRGRSSEHMGRGRYLDERDDPKS